MKVELVDITENAEEKISKYSAVCYDSDTTDELKNEKRIKHLMKVRHLATLRFAQAVFKVSGISRACSHQLVRHPHLSYLQRSQRYVNEEGFENVEPQFGSQFQEAAFKAAMEHAQTFYDALIFNGMKKEDARMVLPNAATTEMYIAGNLNAWKDFITLRTSPQAQREIREVALEIEKQLQGECPHVFGERE